MLCSHVMKQILLGITSIWTEMGFGEMSQALGAGAALWEIKFLQRLDDPHIHRERRLESVGEQQHAIGNFAANAEQLHEFVSGDIDGQFTQSLEVQFSCRDNSSGFEQVRRAKAHLARAQFGFREARKASRGRKRKSLWISRRGRKGFAEAFAEQ